MRNRRLYTFVIANHAVSRVWRISIPYPVLICLGAFALIGLTVALTAGYQYAKMALQVLDYNHLLKENDAFRAENHSYRIQTAQLGEKIDSLETTSRKLMILSGMSGKNGLGGVGGYSKQSFAEPLPSSAGTLPSIDTYNQRVESLETRMRGLQERISEKALVDAARPNLPPVNGYINQGMGRRKDPFNPSTFEYHPGVDVSAPYGTRIVAPADGIVLFAGYRAGYGNAVVLDHKFGITTLYGHLSKVNVKPGQRVSRLDVIGFVGNSGRSSGPHLHYEVRRYERPVNPVDYMHGGDRDSKTRPQVAARR